MPILIYIYICMPDSLLGTSTSIENVVKRNTRRDWPDGWDGLRVGGQRLDFEGIICYLRALTLSWETNTEKLRSFVRQRQHPALAPSA